MQKSGVQGGGLTICHPSFLFAWDIFPPLKGVGWLLKRVRCGTGIACLW